jgi:hypothetical protein
VLYFFAALTFCTPRATAPSILAASDAELDDDASPASDTATYAAHAQRHCTVRGALPDPICTPGAVMTTDLNVICHQSTKNRRNVPTSLKRQVFADYGIAYPQPAGAYEIDHLVSLELGGDNTIQNLWPEAASPAPGFHQKDVVENETHKRVCAGQLKIEDAQRVIAADWRHMP